MTYKIVDNATEILTVNNTKITPILTLEDEYGGGAMIYVDDGCYILSLKVFGNIGTKYKNVFHWFPEAVDALKTLPSNPKN